VTAPKAELRARRLSCSARSRVLPTGIHGRVRGLWDDYGGFSAAVSPGSSDPHLPAEDIALGYKQLLEAERGWRDLKQVIDLRPVYHRKEQRIRAHVILCWLALLLIRIAETTCYTTWPRLHRELQRVALDTFTGPAGT
jgi:hypothetical protein